MGYKESKFNTGKFYTWSEKAKYVNENDEDVKREMDRADAKRKKRVLEISGNPNHILNWIKGAGEFEIEQRELKKVIQKDPCTKKWLSYSMLSSRLKTTNIFPNSWGGLDNGDFFILQKYTHFFLKRATGGLFEYYGIVLREEK